MEKLVLRDREIIRIMGVLEGMPRDPLLAVSVQKHQMVLADRRFR